MKILSQRDPQWSGKKLGESNLTVGKAGCTTTCLSMLSDYFGQWISPDLIAAHEDFYTAQGLVLWSALRFPKMVFEKRLYGRNDAEIMNSIKDPTKAVILEVANHSHWVVALGKDIFGRMRIADPWDGKKKTMAAYGNDITGSAHFNLKTL